MLIHPRELQGAGIKSVARKARKNLVPLGLTAASLLRLFKLGGQKVQGVLAHPGFQKAENLVSFGHLLGVV